MIHEVLSYPSPAAQAHLKPTTPTPSSSSSSGSNKKRQQAQAQQVRFPAFFRGERHSICIPNRAIARASLP
jgi:hypothetical protein